MSKSLSALIALYKRVTQENCSRCSLKKSDVSDYLFLSHKPCNSLEKIVFFIMFLTFFHCFFPFYAQERISPVALRSVALYKRVT